ncbi:hypothetical protein [Streptomyces sp. NBC_01104]|uniref:hypothetical protein n=1 Tax=Streptomyces sp. NBC_01104 TaxID=2903750 RepID=UPI00386940A2|nr:hypothetical protein OG450_15405 [Streptomyces sp. NBC_01104]
MLRLAVAAVLLVATTWLVATWSNDPGGTAADNTPHGAGTHGEESTAPQPGPEQTAPDTTTPSPEPSVHEVIFKSRPLSLRAPSGSDAVAVDLDTPRVGSPGESYSSDSELLMDGNLNQWEFLEPMGKSAGPTPEQCLRGAQSDVLPSKIEEEDLRSTLPVGALLCTVTSEENVAMVKVTKVEGSGGMPDYFTQVTLWRQ